METIIAYVDDAAHVPQLLEAVGGLAAAQKVQWVLVACAPRITHRVSKFVSNRSRENWRNKWAERLFEQCVPALTAQGLHVRTVLARGPLPELLASLQAEHGAACQVLDVRRATTHALAEEAASPALAPAASTGTSPWHKLSGTLAGFGALWAVLVGEAMAA